MPYVADDEERARIAKHWGGLGSPVFWAHVVHRQVERMKSLQSAFASILEASVNDGTPIPAVHGYDARFYYPGEMALEASLLLIALHDVSRFASTRGLAAARAPEDREAAGVVRELAPRLRQMRDLVEHADVAVQRRDEMPFGVEFAKNDDFRGELLLRVGGDVIRLYATSDAMLRLAKSIDEGILEAMDPSP